MISSIAAASASALSATTICSMRIRGAPAWSGGITFTRPEMDLANDVRVLRREKGCHLVFVLSHMGLAQQLHRGYQDCGNGRRVDYMLGAHTHECVL